jgi:hypothetical protein
MPALLLLDLGGVLRPAVLRRLTEQHALARGQDGVLHEVEAQRVVVGDEWRSKIALRRGPVLHQAHGAVGVDRVREVVLRQVREAARRREEGVFAENL